jgi:hypothetical protein
MFLQFLESTTATATSLRHQFLLVIQLRCPATATVS